MKNFNLEIPTDSTKMEQFQSLMNDYHDELNAYIQQVARDLGISQACAADVVYLRNRSRHTEELEQELIRLHTIGTPPNIMEFG